MSLLACLTGLRSVRNFVPDKPVPEPTLRAILEAGRLAPSSNNAQPWRFMLLSSQPWLDRVHAAYPQSWFMAAPHVLVIKGCSFRAWVRLADGRSFLETDLAIAMTHMTLAAWASGVGSCWVNNFEPDVLRRSLGLGMEESVYAISPLGFADPQVPVAPRNRKSFDEVAIFL